MSFFKKLTDEFKELKANFEDKPKEEKNKEEKKTDSKPADGTQEGATREGGYGGPGYADQSQHPGYQQPSYGQPPQQYGSYPAPPPQHSAPPGQPPLPPGWMAQFDQNSQKWYYVEQATGRTQWEPPAHQYQQGGYGAPPPPQGSYQSGPPPGGYSGERGHGEAGGFYNQYGGAMPAQGQSDYQHQQNAQQYYGDAENAEKKGEKKDKDKDKDKKKDKDNGTRNMLLAGAGGLAVGGIAGAMIAHDSDSDDEYRSTAPAPSYAAAPATAAMAPAAAAPYASDPYASDPYAASSAGYGAPYGDPAMAPPPAHDSDADSLREAQQNYNEAVKAAADSDASSSELEELQEAREELEEAREDYYED
ncbi:uncharacterized protein MYCFIDRAFT_87575 [Pseudocercospora fijiensis CIRAD86]|uniref:WW domain-containing protein n=1 Tax=Pseudocercospora fijiensis (strain CIRAD86) TaxID=383855 RepID=N1Q7R8_PSEFD|nr:uncharacterized protein MYCFIDRAFT_87575 [Pseudocercospora fijiensis CIRAD86]EME88789.1 hypothetical protein MYCFIDRAFT_87575 [Pseudocercospora fijiensis CIRAD86]